MSGTTAHAPATIDLSKKLACLKDAYDCAELENSNLRRCLAWAGRHLAHAQRLELAKMIRNKSLQEGGVVECGEEARVQEAREHAALCVRAADLLCSIVDNAGEPGGPVHVPDAWFAQADAVANQLRAFEPPAAEATLAEIRNTKEVMDKCGP